MSLPLRLYDTLTLQSHLGLEPGSAGYKPGVVTIAPPRHTDRGRENIINHWEGEKRERFSFSLQRAEREKEKEAK